MIKMDLQPEKILQTCILGFNALLAWKNSRCRFFSEQKLTTLFVGVLITLCSCLWVSIRVALGAYETIPGFEIIYLIFISSMIPFFCDNDNPVADIALAFRVFELKSLTLPDTFFQAFIIACLPPGPLEDKRWKLVAVPLNYLIYQFMTRIDDFKTLNGFECHLFSILATNILYLSRSGSLHFQFLKAGLICLIGAIFVNETVSLLLPNSTYKHAARSMISLGVLLIGFPFAFAKVLVFQHENSLNWIKGRITSSKSSRSISWAWLVFSFLLMANIFTSQPFSKKTWKILTVLLISVSFLLDPELNKICLSATILFTLCAEYLRYLKLEPFGALLDFKLRTFFDANQEGGQLITSHICFIIGVAAPLLLNNSPVGLISLGLGVPLSSTIDRTFGKQCWSASGKTIEGTAAFVICTFIASIVLARYSESSSDPLKLLLVCSSAGILEGIHALNNNLTIPAFMLVAVESLKQVPPDYLQKRTETSVECV